MNNTSMRRFLLLLGCLLTFQGSVPGQQQEAMIVGVRTLALDTNFAGFERYLETPDGYQLLLFSTRQPGQLIQAYANQKGLPIFRKREDPESGVQFEVADTVSLPGGAKAILLLTTGTPDHETYIPMDDKFFSLAYNTWLMINITSKTLGFRIGANQKPIFLEPNSIQNYRVSAEKGKGVPVSGQVGFNDKIKRTFYSTYWRIRENERSIIIFHELDNKIKVRKIGDRLIEVEEKSPETVR